LDAVDNFTLARKLQQHFNVFKLAQPIAKLMTSLVILTAITIGKGAFVSAQAHPFVLSASSKSSDAPLVALAAIGVGAAGFQRRRG